MVVGLWGTLLAGEWLCVKYVIIYRFFFVFYYFGFSLVDCLGFCVVLLVLLRVCFRLVLGFEVCFRGG